MTFARWLGEFDEVHLHLADNTLTLDIRTGAHTVRAQVLADASRFSDSEYTTRLIADLHLVLWTEVSILYNIPLHILFGGGAM